MPALATESGGLGEALEPCAGGPWGTQAVEWDKPMFGIMASCLCGRNAQVPRFQHLRRPLIGNRASRRCDPDGKGVPGPRQDLPPPSAGDLVSPHGMPTKGCVGPARRWHRALQTVGTGA